MSDEISFGEIQRPEPDRQLRPDQDSHLAVVPVANPHPEDLPIFIDIDTVKDIEAHAVEDTSIELGGVLLGGQFLDESGRPFVLVKDSLRAQHYQATQSSFTFTHETWETICKQKDQFPPGTEIVGWYHTHPDFGIFLSGMDMFICNGFFNGPLDVALVVDPVRQDRGWFHWVDQDGQATKRRTGGYYLFGSRFRADELNTAASQLIYDKDNELMRGVSQINQQPSGGGGTVQVFQTDQKWVSTAVLGSLTVQTVILAGIFFMIYQQNGFSSGPSKEVASAKIESEAVSSILKEMLDQKQAEGAKVPDLTKLMKNRTKWTEVSANLKAVTSNNQSLRKDVETLDKRLQNTQAKFEKESAGRKALKTELDDLKKTRAAEAKLVAEARDKGFLSWWGSWVNIGIAIVVVGLAAVGGLAGGIFMFGQKEEEEDPVQTIS